MRAPAAHNLRSIHSRPAALCFVDGRAPEGRHVQITSDIRRARGRIEDLAKRGQARVELERERRYTVALSFTILEHSRQTAASVLAGALAFRLFLTLLPLTLVAVVGFGLLE